MALKVITGYKGDGKTCLGTSMAWKGYRKGRRIFSNYMLTFPFIPLDLKEMITKEGSQAIREGIIMIDEAQTFVDCRLAGTKKNRLFSYLMLQGRKRKIDIIMTSQQIENLDIRIRRNVEHLYECTALKIVEDKMKLRPATVEEKENHDIDLIKVVFTDFSANRRMKMLFNPHPYFEMYDSDEFVDITDE